MKRMILIATLTFSLVGCSYIPYFTLKQNPAEQDHYATLVVQAKNLSHYCDNHKMVMIGLPAMQQEAEIASTLSAAVSTDEVEGASSILNKMVGEMYNRYMRWKDVPPSTEYCKIKLKTIQNISEELLDITTRIGG